MSVLPRRCVVMTYNQRGEERRCPYRAEPGKKFCATHLAGGLVRPSADKAEPEPCPHPADAVMWNEFNGVTQCHRCGVVVPRVPRSFPKVGGADRAD